MSELIPTLGISQFIKENEDRFTGALTESDLDKWLETQVWGKRYSGSYQKILILSPYQMLMLRYHQYIAFLFQKYRNNPLSKYFWMQLPKRVKKWYSWHNPKMLWWALQRSWHRMYTLGDYEKRYDKDFNYDFEENLPGYIPPVPEEEDWEE